MTAAADRDDDQGSTRMSRSLSSGAHSRDPLAHAGYERSIIHGLRPIVSASPAIVAGSQFNRLLTFSGIL
jgi:hypothetical protein